MSDQEPTESLRKAELKGFPDPILYKLREKAGLSLDGNYFICEGCHAKTWQDHPEREEFRGDIYCVKCGVMMPFEDLRPPLNTDDCGGKESQ